MKIAYYASTALLTALMLFSTSMYLFNHEAVVGAFQNLGYPSYLIYPLATAKILGLLAIWTNVRKSLTEWAYAGFFFDVVLATAAHVAVGDGGALFAILGIGLVLVSYFTRHTRQAIPY